MPPEDSNEPVQQASSVQTLKDEIKDDLVGVFGSTSPYLPAVMDAVEKYPSFVYLSAPRVRSCLKDIFPDWDDTMLWNVAAVMAERRPRAKAGLQLFTVIQSTCSYQEKGAFARICYQDPTLPKPATPEQVRGTWEKGEWENCLPVSSNRENMIEKLSGVANFGGCKFELRFASEAASLFGSIKPDLILSLRDRPVSHFMIGGIITVCESSLFGNDYFVGKWITRGEVFLHKAGPERRSVALGITDLKLIKWFRIVHLENELRIGRGHVIADVRESICGFLHAEPALLGVTLTLKILQLPSSFRLVQHLGSGCTSNVYLVSHEGSMLAVKVPYSSPHSKEDIEYLEALADIDGVPKLHSVTKSMLVLEPVCEPLSRGRLLEYRAKGSPLPLSDLVETLEGAHAKCIVNRDLRTDNIMIGKSLYRKGMLRLFIMDWGFAARIGVESEFAGSLITASNLVLEQMCHLQKRARNLVVYLANDDLVSLVHCLFFFFNPDSLPQICKIRGKPEELLDFWKQQAVKYPFWGQVEEYARLLQYAAVKQCIDEMELAEGMKPLAWCAA